MSFTDGSHRSVTGWLGSQPVKQRIAMVLYWSAIVLPALYLPLLFVGVQSPAERYLVLVLVGFHVVALVGGRSHRRNSGR